MFIILAVILGAAIFLIALQRIATALLRLEIGLQVRAGRSACRDSPGGMTQRLHGTSWGLAWGPTPNVVAG
jgi:hypothetical protein